MEAVWIMMMVVAVVIIFMLEVNREMGLLFGFVIYLVTLYLDYM